MRHDRIEVLRWGKTVQGDYEMTITTPRWQRTLQLHAWMDRPKRSFIRILEPAKEKGIGSLRVGGEMWNYLPTVERTIKIPPSMMLQPWMGSDLTNDDLGRQFESGAPGRIRTHDPLVRSQVLYPTELRARAGKILHEGACVNSA